MLLAPRVLEAVALAAAAVALLAVLLALRLARRVSQLRAAVERRQVAGEWLRGDPTTRRGAAELSVDPAPAGSAAAGGIRHVAVVRYDALSDLGGRLSFSAALLDDAGNGLVLTSINGRAETRTYAKGVRVGTSTHTLSPEEQEAIGFAVRGEQPTYDAEPEPAGPTRRGLRRG